MNSRAKILSITLVLAVAVVSASLAEDLTIVSKVTTSKGSPTTSTQYITASKIRSTDGQSDTIVDIKAEKLIQIDHKKQQYYEATFQEMQAHFAELEQMMQSNPMMGKMLGSVSEVQVEKGSETREIAGYTCHKYTLTMGENFRFAIWAAPDLKMPIEYYDARKIFYAQMGPMGSRFEKMFEKMKEIDGFALATDVQSKMMGMDMSSLTEAIEVKKGPIPDDTFEPPTGYKKKKAPFEG